MGLKLLVKKKSAQMNLNFNLKENKDFLAEAKRHEKDMTMFRKQLNLKNLTTLDKQFIKRNISRSKDRKDSAIRKAAFHRNGARKFENILKELNKK